MKFSIALLFACLSFSFLGLQAQEKKDKQEKKVLVFTKTEGYWHRSIPTGVQTIEDLGEDNGFEVKSTEDADIFNDEDLQDFDLVIFLSTTGDVLDEKQQDAFRKYIEKGGSFFGIHAAADTEYDWPWYGKLVGAYFQDHPAVTRAKVLVQKPDHPAVAHLPKVWLRTDEWYNYKDINPDITVLLKLDESSYEGGKNGKDHPIAWFRNLPGGGVSIYTGGGHTIESYIEPAFRRHLLESILFALGEAAPDGGKSIKG